MRRAPTIAGLALLVFAVALGAYKLATRADPVDATDGPLADDEKPRRSKWFWQRDKFDPEEDFAPPVRARTMKLVKASTSEPFPGVKVKLLRSPLFKTERAGEHSLLQCDDLQHL